MDYQVGDWVVFREEYTRDAIDLGFELGKPYQVEDLSGTTLRMRPSQEYSPQYALRDGLFYVGPAWVRPALDPGTVVADPQEADPWTTE